MISYPEMNRIALIYPTPRILLGEEIYWTEKRDGSQLRISFDGELHIATHHQDDASAQFKQCFLDTEQSSKVIEYLNDTNGFPVNSNCDFNIGAVVFGELLVKGKSPARFETHEKHEFVVFDIYSQKNSRFLPYNNVYQQMFHYQIPVVKCWAITKHETEESLLQTRDDILEIAKREWREKVFERDNYTCQECGDTKSYLHPHHVKGFALYKELRYDANNGLTLCKNCHLGLHGLIKGGDAQ